MGLIIGMWIISIHSLATLALGFPNEFRLFGAVMGPLTAIHPIFRGHRLRIFGVAVTIAALVGAVLILRDYLIQAVGSGDPQWTSFEYLAQGVLCLVLGTLGLAMLTIERARSAVGVDSEARD